ncbi:chromate resistance protein ChrB domain-containing protein [Fulvimarina pelagi]|nr:sulfurtransferase/chromate resistance protein [Fulvimarina pelagi]
MPSSITITHDKLARLVGTPNCPLIVDVRTEEDFSKDPRIIPGSLRRRYAEVSSWAADLIDRKVVVVCHKGAKLSHGVAAWLRYEGVTAEVLEGGYVAWMTTGLPLVPEAKLPKRDNEGRTIWVSRARPKVDRIACPWLIRRFIDPFAVFLFVQPSEIEAVGERFGAAPLDVEGVFWSHRGERCTFDTMVEELGLGSPAMLRLATLVRGADTARLDLAPEAAGLLAASLGLSRMFSDDLEQLEAGLLLYDAFYRWCQDATDETHSWPSRKVGARDG